MNNTDSFTDEDLLNLVNNTIKTKTDFSIDEFTGGYVSMTSTRGHTKESFKVALLFGYKNRNSLSYIFDISKDHVFIWTKAFMTKLASIQVNDIGMDFNELHGLMKTPINQASYDERTTDRTMTHCTSTSYLNTSTSIPPTPVNNRTNVEFMRMKEGVVEDAKHHFTTHGFAKAYSFNGKEVSFSDRGIPYFRDSSVNLNFSESDAFIEQAYLKLYSQGLQK